jgi:hypothetical protein
MKSVIIGSIVTNSIKIINSISETFVILILEIWVRISNRRPGSFADTISDFLQYFEGKVGIVGLS